MSYQWRGSSGYRSEGDGLWTGSYNEPLVEVGARYYLVSMGVFITRDKNLGQRPYEYYNADPVNNVDPSGHSETQTQTIYNEDHSYTTTTTTLNDDGSVTTTTTEYSSTGTETGSITSTLPSGNGAETAWQSAGGFVADAGTMTVGVAAGAAVIGGAACGATEVGGMLIGVGGLLDLIGRLCGFPTPTQQDWDDAGALYAPPTGSPGCWQIP